MIPVKGHSHLFRDESTGAILNMSPEYERHMSIKQRLENKEKEFQDLKEDVASMKDMMQQILSKLL